MLHKRGEIHILNGASGSGKTTILMQALSKWERGEEFPMMFDASSCAYLVADRSEEQALSFVKRLGLQKVEVYGFVGDPTFPMSLLKDAEALMKECFKKLKRKFDLLILDPLMPFMRIRNSKDMTAVMESLIPLTRLARAMNITIVGVHHATKTRSDFTFLRPQDRISGSSAFQGYSCDQMTLIEGIERGEHYHMLSITSHFAPEETYTLDRDCNGFFIPVPEEELKLGKLRHVFKQKGKVSSKDLISFAENLGISKSTLYRELKKLRVDGSLSKEKHGMYVMQKGVV